MSDGSWLLVEVARGTLSRVRPDGAVEVIAELGGGPNGAALGPDGAVYVCNNGGFRWHEGAHGLRPLGQADDYRGGRIERVDPASGEVRVLYDAGPNGPLKGPNDIVFDRSGGMWFTDLGKARAVVHHIRTEHRTVHEGRVRAEEIVRMYGRVVRERTSR